MSTNRGTKFHSISFDVDAETKILTQKHFNSPFIFKVFGSWHRVTHLVPMLKPKEFLSKSPFSVKVSKAPNVIPSYSNVHTEDFITFL